MREVSVRSRPATRRPKAARPPGGNWLSRIDPRVGALLFAGEVILLLLAWQVLVGGLGLVNPLFLPPPLATAEGFVELYTGGTLPEHITASLGAWAIGYGLAAGVGIVAGLLVGSSVAADRLTGPILWTIYATPWLAYRPLTKAWFGFGLGPIIALVFIASVFPILLNTSAGIRTTSRSLLSAGRIFGATRAQLYTKIVLPSTVPYILAGLRQSAVMATIALVVAEMTGSSTGIGALIAYTANTYNTNQSFAAIVMVVIWSVGMSQLIRLVGRWVAPWTAGQRPA